MEKAIKIDVERFGCYADKALGSDFLWHGGCHGCDNARVTKPISGSCVECCYFAADWTLPNKNTESVAKKEIGDKKLREYRQWLPDGYAPINSEPKQWKGIRRCAALALVILAVGVAQ